MMILYGAPMSPFVRKVLAYADVKGLTLDLVQVGIGDPNPDFIAASPFKKMPGFSDGDFKISDSTAIIAYLEAKHPEPVMIPADPEERARVTWFEEFADTILTVNAAGPIFFNRVVAPIFLKQPGDAAAADKAEKDEFPKLCAYLEGVIPASGYLVGDRLTLADIAVASPFVNAAHCAVVPDPIVYPKVTAFLAKMLALPGFARSIAGERKALGLN
jgi:glutathione S-transferase